MLSIGNVLFNAKEDFDCFDDAEIIPLNNSGATFLLFYTLLIFLFAFTLWIIYYKIPDKYGLIYKNQKGVNLESREHSQSLILIDEIKNLNNDDDVYSTSPSNKKLKNSSNDDFGASRTEIASEDGDSPLKHSNNSAITPYYNKTYGN